jgi:putative transposase
MPRNPRIVIPGLPHHITHRGNNRQNIFYATEHYSQYIEILHHHLAIQNATMLGYCLMPNHIHLAVIPYEIYDLADVVGKTHSQYTKLINKLRGTSGHLWENRFYSYPLEVNHLINTLKYIEQNPVRAEMVLDPMDYEWSSAQAHIDKIDKLGILDMGWWGKFIEQTGLYWPEVLNTSLKSGELGLIRNHILSCAHLK